MTRATFHLVRRRVGHPPHYCEGFTTQAEAEAARAIFDLNDSFAAHGQLEPCETEIFPPAQYREELTAEGIQLVIPGCEKITDTKTPAQLALF